MTSSRLQTLADGSPIPRYDTQSPKTVFTIGKIQTLGNIIYGYSGIVNFDITAALTYPLLRFTLEKNAMIRAQYQQNWRAAAVAGIQGGFQVSIDGVIVHSWKAQIDNDNQYVPTVTDFLLPAGRDCNIVVLNPDTSAALIQANCIVQGQYV